MIVNQNNYNRFDKNNKIIAYINNIVTKYPHFWLQLSCNGLYLWQKGWWLA